jgi:uncharacterized protein YjeT (DUF2065 family)
MIIALRSDAAALLEMSHQEQSAKDRPAAIGWAARWPNPGPDGQGRTAATKESASRSSSRQATLRAGKPRAWRRIDAPDHPCNAKTKTPEPRMKRTHLSLYYLAGYLLPSGIALMFAPRLTLDLLQASGDYGDVMPRLLGLMLLALGILVLQIIRLRVSALYGATLMARGVILAGLLGLYLHSSDPLFLMLLGVVGLGFVLTGLSYLADRNQTH